MICSIYILSSVNIKRENGTISANYNPEDSGKLGFVSLDIETCEILERELSELDKGSHIYLHHAVSKLKQIRVENEIPSELLVAWY